MTDETPTASIWSRLGWAVGFGARAARALVIGAIIGTVVMVAILEQLDR